MKQINHIFLNNHTSYDVQNIKNKHHTWSDMRKLNMMKYETIHWRWLSLFDWWLDYGVFVITLEPSRTVEPIPCSVPCEKVILYIYMYYKKIEILNILKPLTETASINKKLKISIFLTLKYYGMLGMIYSTPWDFYVCIHAFHVQNTGLLAEVMQYHLGFNTKDYFIYSTNNPCSTNPGKRLKYMYIKEDQTKQNQKKISKTSCFKTCKLFPTPKSHTYFILNFGTIRGDAK